MKYIYNHLAIGVVLFLSAVQLNAQNSVGIGTTTPNPHSILDLVSTDQGLLIPRIDTFTIISTIKPTLTAADDGLMIYADEINAFIYWDGDSLDWYLLNENVMSASGDDGDWGVIGDTVYNNFAYVVVGGDNTDILSHSRMLVLNNGTRTALSGSSVGDGTNAIGIEGYATNSNTNIGVIGIAESGNFTDTIAAFFGEARAHGNDYAVGLRTEVNDAGSTGVGISSSVNNDGSVANSTLRGGEFSITAFGTNPSATGVSGQANYAGGPASGSMIGLYGDASGGISNYAGYFDNGDVFVQNYVGIGVLNPFYELDVAGTALVDTLRVSFSPGSNHHLVDVDGTGKLVWQPISGGNDTLNIIADADRDTYIDVDESDDDAIHFYDYNGVTALENFRMDNGHFSIFNTGASVFVGAGAGANDDLTNNNNVFVGNQAGANNTTGAGNIAIGTNSLLGNVSGQNNTAIGQSALLNNTANNNHAIGINALSSNETGTNNLAYGSNALQDVVTGNFNTAIGNSSLANTTGGFNTAVGYATLVNNIGGEYNTVIGYLAANSNTTGNRNTALGYASLNANSTGSFNIGVGHSTLGNSTDDFNTAIGYQAGDGLQAGASNTFVGYNADAGTPTLNNATAIGAGAIVSQDSSLILGNAAKVGIGTSVPSEKLEVVTASNNYGLLHSDGAVQVGSWVGGAGGFYGTKTNHNLTLFTNNNAGAGRITITPGGGVGVGTNAPNAGFHIQQLGSGLANGIRLTTSLGTAREWFTYMDANDDLQINNGATFGATFQKITGYVGIGNSTPSTRLDVGGKTRTDSLMVVQGGGTAGNVLTDDGTGNAVWQTPVAGGDTLGNHIASQNLEMSGNYISNDGGDEGLFVNTLGNVGVNTNNPGVMFDVGNSLSPVTSTLFRVNGTGYFRTNLGFNAATALTLENTNSSSTGVTLDFTSKVGAATTLRARISGLSSGTDEGALSFTTRTGIAWTEKMRIDHLGHVGIGTDAPDTTLHVVGNIKMVDGNEAAGYVMTSDLNGVGYWAPAGAGGADADWTLATGQVYNQNDDVGVGVIPTERFQVGGVGSGALAIDQSAPSSGAFGALTAWQSFTVGNSGDLQEIAVNLTWAGVGFDINIYQGEGTAGTLLHSITNVSSVSGMNRYSLGANIPVVSGSQYTFELIGSHPVAYNHLNPYPGGRSSIGGTFDLEFQTWVQSSATSIILSANTSTNRVGVGTDSPSSTLDVQGDMNFTQELRVNGDQGASGQVLTSQGAGSAPIWQTASESNAFSTSANITSNAPGNYISDNFVFGSPSLDDDGDANHDRRMLFDKSNGSFRAGTTTGGEWNNRGTNSVGLGSNALASGPVSVAMGESPSASGFGSVAIGSLPIASANYAVAIGRSTSAAGTFSTAIGNLASTTGSHSVAIGNAVTSPSFSEMTVGLFPVLYTPASATAFNIADRVFTVGNGSAAGSRSNAMTIMKNGNVGVGENDPSSKLDVLAPLGSADNIVKIGESGTSNKLKVSSGTTAYTFGGGDGAVTRHDIIVNHSNGNVGIGSSLFPAQKLDVDNGGSIEVDGEYTYETQKTHYLNLNARAFRGNDPTQYDTWDTQANAIYGYFHSQPTTIQYASAAVQLPDGAIIQSITAYIYDFDGSVTYQPRFDMFYVTNVGGFGAMANAELPADNLTFSPVTDNSIANGTIDNENRSYYLRYRSDASSDSKVRLTSIRIEYTVSQAD